MMDKAIESRVRFQTASHHKRIPAKKRVLSKASQYLYKDRARRTMALHLPFDRGALIDAVVRSSRVAWVAMGSRNNPGAAVVAAYIVGTKVPHSGQRHADIRERLAYCATVSPGLFVTRT